MFKVLTQLKDYDEKIETFKVWCFNGVNNMWKFLPPSVSFIVWKYCKDLGGDEEEEKYTQSVKSTELSSPPYFDLP